MRGFYPKRTCRTKNQVLNEVTAEELKKGQSQADTPNIVEQTKGDLLDLALLMGMSPDEYWYGDPSLIYNYQNAFEMKQRYDLQMAWTQGAYFKSALGSTQVWTVQPFKSSDWQKMPTYVENPVEELRPQPKQEITKEKIEMMQRAKNRLSALGLLHKEN